MKEFFNKDDLVPTMQWWIPTRRHINPIALEARSKNWALHRTLDDHGVLEYVEAVKKYVKT